MLDVFRTVWSLVRPYRTRFIIGVLCGFLSGLFAPALPFAAKLAVDVIFRAKQNHMAATMPGVATNGVVATNLVASATSGTNAAMAASNSGALNVGGGLLSSKRFSMPSFIVRWQEKFTADPSRGMIIFVILLIPAVMFVRGILAYLNVYLMTWVGTRAIFNLRFRMFEHIMSLSMNFFNRISTGDVMSRMYEVSVLQNTITTSVVTIIREPITILSLIGVLMVQQTKLTLITLAVFPVCIIPIVVYGNKMRRSSRAIQQNASELSTVMHEAITGSRIIKAYNLEKVVVNQYWRATQQALTHTMRMVRASEIPGPVIEFLGACGVALFFVYFAFMADAGTGPEALIQFVISIFLIYPPIKALSKLHSQLIQAQMIKSRMDEILQTQNSIPEPAQPKPLRAAGVDITFENVSFQYDNKPVLTDIHLTAKASQLVALVGGSGAGKTTLTNLLLRFYDPQQGSIRIGGMDIRDVATRDLRSQIAVVTQETILFNDTIRNNIALGREGATDAEIEQAARNAHALDFILEKEHGFDFPIGEKGSLLSGGQKQRLAIARAILKNAPILILDEATSALDTESERAVQAALEDLMVGRTTICIAHRLSTIYKADLIVVMDQGRIVETGTHEELLKRNGHYRHLYELQFQK